MTFTTNVWIIFLEKIRSRSVNLSLIIDQYNSIFRALDSVVDGTHEPTKNLLRRYALDVFVSIYKMWIPPFVRRKIDEADGR